MSEWLGTGLQNRSQRFESAWHLKEKLAYSGLFLYLIATNYSPEWAGIVMLTVKQNDTPSQSTQIKENSINNAETEIRGRIIKVF